MAVVNRSEHLGRTTLNICTCTWTRWLRLTCIEVTNNFTNLIKDGKGVIYY